MHHAVGIFTLIALITLAFGKDTAIRLVAVSLILGAVAVLYVIVRVITGTV